jgi:hypothetical protein
MATAKVTEATLISYDKAIRDTRFCQSSSIHSNHLDQWAIKVNTAEQMQRLTQTQPSWRYPPK